jgi:hypothetical protein
MVYYPGFDGLSTRRKAYDMRKLLPARLPWTKIRDLYSNEWIELVDYRWDWNRHSPLWGVVRNHASSKPELLKRIQVTGETSRSIIMYIGATNPLVADLPAAANL